MQVILETPRCYLREFTPGDAENCYLLNSDPEVIRYTGDPPFESVDAAHAFLLNYKDYEKNNMGRWAVIRKTDQEWLGWCGLKLIPETGEIDLGYRFHRKFWGQGFATETAKACVNYGFKTLKINRIIGRSEKENVASIKVLEKCNMNFLKTTNFEERPGVLYEIFNNQ